MCALRDGGTSTGCLIAVVGASGAGKDTLINAARRHFGDCADIVFPRRVITRFDQVGEDHVAVTPERFAEMEHAGAFLLSWHAHGHGYGIPIAVEQDLRAGRTVIINGSRRVVNDVRVCWPSYRIVQIVVPVEVLRARLAARGREKGASIEARLDRAAAFDLAPAPDILRIDNSGPVEAAAACMIDCITACARS